MVNPNGLYDSITLPLLQATEFQMVLALIWSGMNYIIKWALHIIWCGVNRLGDSGVTVKVV